jgi:hypothetical protein
MRCHAAFSAGWGSEIENAGSVNRVMTITYAVKPLHDHPSIARSVAELVF